MSLDSKSLLVLGVVVLLGGCGDSSADSPGSREEGLALQAEYLSDGLITEEEEEEAIRGFLQCMFDGGYQVGGPEWEPSRRVMIYKVRSANEAQQGEMAEVYESCYSAYAGQVDPVYQSANFYDYEGAQEDADEYRRCLVEAGWPGFVPEMTPREVGERVSALREELGNPPCEDPFVPDTVEILNSIPYWER